MFCTIELSCTNGQKEPGLFVYTAANTSKGFLLYDVPFKAVTYRQQSLY